MGHDQLFKALLQGHFREFLELFFREVAEQLDFGTLRFLDKELFVDVPDGGTRVPDIVAEIETHDGEPELVLVHIEIQARPARDFARRMYEYYALPRLRRRRPVFPIVLYLRGGKGLHEEEYVESLFERELLRFRYASVGLAGLKPREYLEVNALGAALAALMNRSGVGDPLGLRVAMLLEIAEGVVEDAKKFLLVNVVESYFRLADDDAEHYRHLLMLEGHEEVREMETTWADEMMEKGRIAEKRSTLLRLMEAKFGNVSEAVKLRIEALEVPEELDAYVERILTVSSIDEMGLG